MKEARVRERFHLLARAMISMVLISAPISLVLANLNVAEGAATVSSTASVTFTVSSDRPNYTGSATIVVRGISPPTSAVTITISNPLHVAVASTPATVAQNNSFSATFLAGGPAWSSSGKYTIVAVVPQPDNVSTPPVTNSTFFYTAVATTTQTSVAASSSSAQGIDTSTFASIAGIAAVIVIAVAVVGIMLRSRGRGLTRKEVRKAQAS